jgi:hypothetical protein
MYLHDISALIALKFFVSALIALKFCAYKNGSQEIKTIIAFQSGGGPTINQ